MFPELAAGDWGIYSEVMMMMMMRSKRYYLSTPCLFSKLSDESTIRRFRTLIDTVNLGEACFRIDMPIHSRNIIYNDFKTM